MFKRDMIIAIREAGTTGIPVALPIVDDSIDVSTKNVSTVVPRNTLGTPQFTDLVVNRGKKETTIKFTTYVKPYLDTNISLVESLLHESLLGNITSDPVQLCTNTINNYTIKKFDVFIIYKDTKVTFKLQDAVTLSGEFIFDIKGLARIKWVIAGIDYIKDTFPNYILPSAGKHLINKFTTAHIDFPQLNSGYDLASTNFSINIKNKITFQYTETITTVYNKPSNNPIIEKRGITCKFSMYLKVITLSMYDDLIQTIESHNNANFNAAITDCTGLDYISITLNNIQVSVPKLKYDDISTLDLTFKGTEALICYKE